MVNETDETNVWEVIYFTPTKIYRSLLYTWQCERLNRSQILFPPNYYTRHFYEQFSTTPWNNLEWLNISV